MTDFQDRERGEERKYAMDEETAFRVAARRNRLLGKWAAEKMGLTPEETDAYASAWYRARVLPVHVRRALIGEAA